MVLGGGVRVGVFYGRERGRRPSFGGCWRQKAGSGMGGSKLSRVGRMGKEKVGGRKVRKAAGRGWVSKPSN